MSLQIVVQNIVQVEHGIIGHGVNCQGVMGSGVAHDLRSTYPQIFDTYIAKCNEHSKKRSFLLGKVDFVDIVKDDLIVANMFTQEYYGKDGKVYSSPLAIYQSLLRVILKANEKKLDIYIPQIGCGLGGLSWDDNVLPLIEELLALFPEVNIIVCNLPNK